jgi:hypothetical protein
MRTAVTAALFGLLVLAVSAPVESCCMVPRDYKGTISQSAQEAVLFHHDGREELVLKINYRIKGDSLPDRFAWVITVPNDPDHYEVADAGLFQELFDWAEKVARLPTKSKDDGPNSLGRGKLVIGQPVRVGPYEIQPVKALGREALGALNTWLDEHGFPKEDPRHMAYFVENKFTFLCVKFDPPRGQRTVAADGGAVPLHLSFKSERPYYPLRFSSRQGVFDVNLYVLTKKPFDYKESGDSLKRINWAFTGFRANTRVAPGDFPRLLKDVYGKTRFKEDRSPWHLNVLRCREVNKGDTIARWEDDIFFRTKG